MSRESTSAFPACGTSIGGYPHGFSLHERCFIYFLERYWRYFTLRVRPAKPWLPHKWDTSLEDPQSRIVADLLGMRFEVLPDTGMVKLIVRLGARGTFTVDGKAFPTRGWTFKLLAPLKMERASAVTGDSYPYYRKAYETVLADYRHVHQVALDLENMATTPQEGDIDYQGADLSADQKTVFLRHIQALMAPSRARGRFVLLYLGGNRRLPGMNAEQTYEQQIAAAEADPGSNDATWLLYFYYPHFRDSESYAVTACRPDARPGELHFAYKVAVCPAGGTGSLRRLLVPEDVEGVFCLGRTFLFHRLGGIAKRLQVHEQAGRVSHLSRSWESGNLQIKTLPAGDEAKLGFTYTFHPTFHLRFPVIGSNGETFPVRIDYRGTRSYVVTLSLGKTAICFSTVDTSKPMEDRWFWKDHLGEHDLAVKYPEFMESINRGSLTDGLRTSIAVTCGRFGDRCTRVVIAAYEAAIDACRDAAAESRQRQTADLELSLGAEQFFVQLPASFTCQKLRFDDQYNLLFNLKMDRLTDTSIDSY